MATWNVVAEFLSRVLKIVIAHHSSYSDRHRVPLWMTTFWTRIACPSGTSRRRSTMSWVHKDESQRFPPSWRASVDIWSSDILSRIGGKVSRWDQSQVNTRYEVLDWFEPSHEVIVLHTVLMYYAIEIGSSLFLSSSFRDFQDFLHCLRCGSILSIYSQEITSYSLIGSRL
jgi:hypothetical protein